MEEEVHNLDFCVAIEILNNWYATCDRLGHQDPINGEDYCPRCYRGSKLEPSKMREYIAFARTSSVEWKKPYDMAWMKQKELEFIQYQRDLERLRGLRAIIERHEKLHTQIIPADSSKASCAEE
jgi:hypothetical protein